MARQRIIEGTWNCTSCGAREVKARHKSCPGCGNPREQTGSESQFDFGATTANGGLQREAVTDTAALDLAAAGADWFCAYCAASNRGDHAECRTCSAARDEARAPDPAPPVAPIATAAALPTRRPRSWLLRGFLFGCLTPMMVVFTGFCGYVFWAIQTNDYEGTVTTVAWSRTARRETFTRVSRQGWRDELKASASVMPQDGRGESAGLEGIRECRRKQRGTRQVADGTEYVCHTKSRSVSCGTEERCRTRDLGNGFSEETCTDVTKYCSESYQDCGHETRYRTEPVYADECTYDTWEWQKAEERTTSGTEDQPLWPDIETGALDRLVRNETYDVEFEYERSGERHRTKYNPATIEEFDRWRPGAKATLVVTNDGRLEGLREGDTVKPAKAAVK